MTPSEKYVEGQWYGWNGGECPVHPDTLVDVVFANVVDMVFGGEVKAFINICEGKTAENWKWSSGGPDPIIAFRVVKHHVEPKVIWVNESNGYGWPAYETKELAIECVSKFTTRVAVRYVETPE